MDDVGCELDSQISHALAGDARGIEWAMGKIYENYERALFATASARLGSPEDAEDAVQEALADLYERAMNATWIENKGSVKAFLDRVLRNKVVDTVRKRKRRSEFLEKQRVEDKISTTSTADTAELFAGSQGGSTFEQFVNSLTAKEKPVAEYLGDYWLTHGKLPSIKKIMGDLGGSVESVKSIRKRLWPKMRNWLAKADNYED